MLDILFEIIHKIYSVADLIGWGGYLILFLIIFAETGLFVGFFLPGDSLLIVAGIFAGAGKLDIVLLNIILIAAAIIGDYVGYLFGERVGKNLFKKDHSKIFKKKHLLRAKDFYERHGGKTIIIARFIPVIRTFAPIVAGATGMNYRKFLHYNVLGGVLWVLSMTLTGYYLGSTIPNIEDNIGPLVIVVIILSLIPAVIGYIKEKRRDKTNKYSNHTAQNRDKGSF